MRPSKNKRIRARQERALERLLQRADMPERGPGTLPRTFESWNARRLAEIATLEAKLGVGL